MKKNILVAFDDSENAERAVEFVGNFFTPDCKVTLFSVISNSDALFLMSSHELSPDFVSQKTSFLSIEEKKKEQIFNALEIAKNKLIKAGFEQHRIKIKAECKNYGIARDIVNESQKGFDVIVMGRRGIKAVKEFFLGSVSQKVFSSSREISILVVN